MPLLTVLIIFALIFAVIGFVKHGLQPLGALKGVIKGAYYFVIGLSAWVAVILVLKLFWWVLLILSIDIITPPYGIDIETLFAFPAATVIQTTADITFGWALAIAYILVFAIAIGIVLLHVFFMRKYTSLL